MRKEIDQDLPVDLGVRGDIREVLAGSCGIGNSRDIAFFKLLPSGHRDSSRARALEEDAIAEQKRHEATIAQAELAQGLLRSQERIDDLSIEIEDLEKREIKKGNSPEIIEHNQKLIQQIDARRKQRNRLNEGQIALGTRFGSRR